ncbi:uncharacterized protein [Gossypium hirsutum]|uniref:Uncharacterized protein n=1 Tax=Gossypium hirsutum TaxID=3635 RepID=A0ABM3ASD7_GOSHI|nr:uncharacterized protein LOC121221193 [Gossypium hirsutum]
MEVQDNHVQYSFIDNMPQSLADLYEQAHKFTEVKSLGILLKPSSMRHSTERSNSRDKCAFHNDFGHKTEDCFTLKDAIEEVVQYGKLVEFVDQGIDEDWVGSNAKRKAHMRSVMFVSAPKRSCHQGRWSVEFGNDNEELVCNKEGNDPMVVFVMIAGFEVKRILVDSGSVVEISSALATEEKSMLVRCLKVNSDVFAWLVADMPSVDLQVIVHKLNVLLEGKMVKQKRRKFALQVVEAVRQEVAKLLSAGFIREVKYPDWVSNVVMVKKILLDHDDQGKTTFIIEEELFYYQVMPFGLKNARATYQILVNRIFREQIRCRLEVYVDDMLVKSGNMEEHVRNLSKAFVVLRAHNIKLNIEKCAFSVQVGRFLGFIISKRGIKVNPKKIRAILEMPPPQTIKDIQSLTCRVVALNRSISRMADKCLTFFKALRTSFSWTKKCQTTFEELKLYLTSPLLLKSLRVGETLYLYLATSKEIVAVVLVRAEGAHQFPVYYISKVLQNSELRYSKIEKSKAGSGAGVLLIDPSGNEWQYGLSFEFQMSNNIAEYEVSISGLQLARQLRVMDLVIHTDSQLVAKQMNGDYEVKEAMLKKYHSVAAQLLIRFDKAQIKQLPRSDNTRADTIHISFLCCY